LLKIKGIVLYILLRLHIRSMINEGE